MLFGYRLRSVITLQQRNDIYSLYASGRIQFNKTLRTSRILYKLVDESHEWYSYPYLYIGSFIYPCLWHI